MTSSEASSSEAEQCAEDAEVERLTTNSIANKVAEAKMGQVTTSSLNFCNPENIIDARLDIKGIDNK